MSDLAVVGYNRFSTTNENPNIQNAIFFLLFTKSVLILDQLTSQLKKICLNNNYTSHCAHS